MVAGRSALQPRTAPPARRVPRAAERREQQVGQIVGDPDERARTGAGSGSVLAEAGRGLRDGALEHTPPCRRRTDVRAAPEGGSTPGRAPRAAASAGTASRPPSGWIAEQTSWTKPGSVSSAVRIPPPTVSAASSTSTERPARASTIAAASPFGPAPTTTASGIGQAYCQALGDRRLLANRGDQRVDNGRVELPARRARSRRRDRPLCSTLDGRRRPALSGSLFACPLGEASIRCDPHVPRRDPERRRPCRSRGRLAAARRRRLPARDRRGGSRPAPLLPCARRRPHPVRPALPA